MSEQRNFKNGIDRKGAERLRRIAKRIDAEEARLL